MAAVLVAVGFGVVTRTVVPLISSSSVLRRKDKYYETMEMEEQWLVKVERPLSKPVSKTVIMS